jgi:1,2-diacylglycerol 3-alpha-glucosyltransferase
MKILFTTESYYPIIDGGAIAQHRIVHELVKKGHDVIVIAPGSSYKNTIEEDNGSIIYRSRGIKLPFYMNGKYHFSLFPLFYVKKIIKSFKPDVINICSAYPTSMSAIVCAKKYEIPLIGSIHMLPENMLAPFSHTRFYKKMCKYAWSYLVYLYNLVDWATIPTQTGADMYKIRGLKTSITPISNGVDIETFKPDNDGEYLRKKTSLPKENIVLYTGRINQEKNLDVFVKAIPLIIKEINAHFLFCGSGGYKKEIITMTKNLGVSNSTTFIDFLDWKDYPNVYSLADVFVMPAESELQSIVTLEAIASGLPVVVVNKGAVPELAGSNNGLLFEPGDSKQLANNIVKILSDKKLYEIMSRNSLQLSKKHSMKNVGFGYERVYKHLLEHHKNK